MTPDSSRARTSRADLGTGLRLVWETERLTAVAGHMPDLRIGLCNVGDERWIANAGLQPDDLEPLLHVLGFLELDGTVLAIHTGVNIHGPTRPQQLEPGQTAILPVLIVTRDVTRLPAGAYRLRAELHPLALHAEPATLHLFEPERMSR